MFTGNPTGSRITHFSQPARQLPQLLTQLREFTILAGNHLIQPFMQFVLERGLALQFLYAAEQSPEVTQGDASGGS